MKKVLIDCDILRYSHGSIQMAHPFLSGEFVPANPEKICSLVDRVIEQTLKDCGTTEYLCVLSGKGNFRHDIAKQVSYKGNRDSTKPRPPHYDTVGNHIIENHPHIIIDGHEADDCMGYMQYDNWKERFKEVGFDIDPDGLETIIASRDKDLRTVQGWHYSWASGPMQPVKPLYYISPARGMYQFFYQMLIGDNTDNIMGCGQKVMTKWGTEVNEEGKEVPRMRLRRKGIGEKTADKILSAQTTVRGMRDAVFEEYLSQFGEGYEDLMLENARLLFIGQTQDNLFEWSWLDKYLDLKNELYIDPDTVPKKTRKRKAKPVEDTTVGTLIPEYKTSEETTI